ncbi:MAG: nitrous oxide reductase family maturation protein NosD [Candidatus Hodarchaeota archaeon]
MGEQTRTRLNPRSAVCKFPPELKRKKPLHRRRRIIMATSLVFILTSTVLVYYLRLPPPAPPYIPLEPIITTPRAYIEINGDANFSTTALLEGWPGDGSPENPYIIYGLGIDLGGENSHCIVIRNTRARFTISNCNFTGAYPISFGGTEAGIYLENVMNGEIVDNIVDSNYNGIIFYRSDYNTVANNTCSSNTNYGIAFLVSDYNTVANNTCSSNGEYGISLYESSSNTVSENTCNNNTATAGKHIGISLYESSSNTVSENTCNNNRIGIYLLASYSNIVVNNTCLNNTQKDIFQEFQRRDYDPEVPEDPEVHEVLLLIGSVVYIGLMVIALLGGILIAHKRVSKEGN